MNTTHWKNDDIYHMTISTYFLKWRCNKVAHGQHSSHLKKKLICSNKKVNENGHKPTMLSFQQTHFKKIITHSLPKKKFHQIIQKQFFHFQQQHCTLCLVCNGTWIFFLQTILVKKSHFNVVFFFIGHSSKENYVVAQFSPLQRGKNPMVAFVLFFYIRFKWPPDSTILKKRNLLGKKIIGSATQISLLPRWKKKL